MKNIVRFLTIVLAASIVTQANAWQPSLESLKTGFSSGLTSMSKYAESASKFIQENPQTSAKIAAGATAAVVVGCFARWMSNSSYNSKIAKLQAIGNKVAPSGVTFLTDKNANKFRFWNWRVNNAFGCAWTTPHEVLNNSQAVLNALNNDLKQNNRIYILDENGNRINAEFELKNGIRVAKIDTLKSVLTVLDREQYELEKLLNELSKINNSFSSVLIQTYNEVLDKTVTSIEAMSEFEPATLVSLKKSFVENFKDALSKKAAEIYFDITKAYARLVTLKYIINAEIFKIENPEDTFLPESFENSIAVEVQTDPVESDDESAE